MRRKLNIPQLESKNSKKVRIEQFLQGGFKALNDANQGNFEAKIKVGSYWENNGNNRVGSGLSIEEERILLPLFFKLDYNDRDFNKKRDDFYTNITTKVPSEGLSLEVGLQENNEAAIEYQKGNKTIQNYPLNLEEYLRYRHLLGSPIVALDKAEGFANPICKVIIVDTEQEDKKRLEKLEIEKKALQEFYKIDEDVEKVRMYLVLMGADIYSIAAAKRLPTLKEMVTEKPAEFLKFVGDENAKTKYAIRSYLTAGILNKYGERYVNAETSETIGTGIDEAVAWMKDKKNAEIVGLFENRYTEYIQTNF